MPKEISLKIRVPTGDEFVEVLRKTIEQFGELVKFEVVEEKPAEETPKPETETHTPDTGTPTEPDTGTKPVSSCDTCANYANDKTCYDCRDYDHFKPEKPK